MARNPKSADNIQVFLGSKPQPDVFAANTGLGCCPDVAGQYTHDKLADRTRFDNALAHLNPSGANDKFRVPFGNGFAGTRRDIIDHINQVGVGAQISVIAIPTYAFVFGVGIHIAAEEPGLTFNLITRNGLVLPGAAGGGEDPAGGRVIVVEAAANPADPCGLSRTQTEGDAESFEGFGALTTNEFIDIFGYDGEGSFSLEADELILEVATVPADPVVGNFDITVSVNYDIVHRAER